YSYAPEDEELLDELKEHLAPLRIQGLIREWDKRNVVAGHDWQQVASQHLEAAELIILLVSASYLASADYEREGLRAIARYRAGEAQVVPVIARASLWRATELAELKVLPAGGHTVTGLPSRDLAWTEVAQGIQQLLETLVTRSFYHWLCAEGR